MHELEVTSEELELISDLLNEEFAREMDKRPFGPHGYADQIKAVIEKVSTARIWEQV